MQIQYAFSTKINKRILLIIPFLFLVALFTQQILKMISSVDRNLVLPNTEISIIHAIPFALITYAIGLIIIMRWNSTLNDVVFIFSIAFLLRIVFGYIMGFAFLYDDERGMHWWSVEFADALNNNNWSSRHIIYSDMTGLLYFLFGHNILLPKTLNAFVGSIMPFFIYELANVTWNNERSARIALYLTAFAPPLVFYSGFYLKEIITSMLMVLSLWSYLCIRHRFIRLVICLINIILLVKFRLIYASFIFIGIFFLVLSGKRLNWNNYKERKRLYIIIVIIIVSGFLLLVLPSPIRNAIYSKAIGDYAESQFKQLTSNTTVGRLLVADQQYSPRNIIILMLRTLLSPHPLRFAFDISISTLIESAIMTTWYILLPIAFIGFWHNRRDSYSIAIMLVAGIGILSVGLANYLGGDFYRHRICFFPFLYILSASGYLSMKQHKIILIAWILITLTFTIIYFKFRDL